MAQKRILDSTANGLETLPLKKSNCGSKQQETFFFMHKKEHTSYISLDGDLRITWEHPWQIVKIKLYKRSFQNTSCGQEQQLDEKSCWEWLKKNIEESLVRPYFPQVVPAGLATKGIDGSFAKIMGNDHENKNSKNNKKSSIPALTDENIKLTIKLIEQGLNMIEIANRFKIHPVSLIDQISNMITLQETIH